MEITPYQSNIIAANYIKPPKYDLGLELKVLQHKQNKYDINFDHLQKLKSKALNINFLNKQASGYIDQYNKEIDTNFDSYKGQFGDLSDSNLVSKYTDMFKNFTNPALVGLYRKESQYRDTLKDINKRSKSKDPKKAGYHRINELVYRSDLSKYSTQDMDVAMDYSVPEFVPYVDVNKLIADAIDNVPESTRKTISINTKTGEKVTKIIKGKDQASVNTIISGIISENMPQVGINSKYNLLAKYNSPDSKIDLLQRVNQVNQGKRDLVQVEIDKLNNSGATKDQEFYDSLQILQNKKTSNKIYDLNSFEEGDILDVITDNFVSNLISGSVSAYAPQSTEVDSELDEVYRFKKELGLKWAKFNLDKELSLEDLAIKKETLDIKKYEAGLPNSINKAAQQVNAEYPLVSSGQTTDLTTEDITSNGLTPEEYFVDPLWDHIQEVKTASHEFKNGNLNLKDSPILEKYKKELGKLNSKIVLVNGVHQIDQRTTKEKSRAAQLEYFIKDPNLTSEEAINKLKDNPNFFKGIDGLDQNTDILAYKEALVDIQLRDKENRNLKDISTKEILEQAELVKQDSRSAAYRSLEDNRNNLQTYEQFFKNWDNKSEKEQKQEILALANNESNIFRKNLWSGNYTELGGTNKTTKGNTSIVRRLLNDKQLLTGKSDLNVASLENEDFKSIVMLKNGLAKVTFSDRLFTKTNLKNRDGEFKVEMQTSGSIPEVQKITPENNELWIEVKKNDGFKNISELIYSSNPNHTYTYRENGKATDITYKIGRLDAGYKIYITHPGGSEMLPLPLGESDSKIHSRIHDAIQKQRNNGSR